MHRITTLLFVASLVCMLSGCKTGKIETVKLVSDEPRLADLTWLTGSWTSTTDNVRSEEHWTQAAAGTMFGINRTMRDGKTVFFEYLRIEVRDTGVFYLASPAGRNPPTEFRMVSCENHKAAFENPEHDFPTRITYWLDGDTLHATAEGTIRGTMRSEVFQWQRATIDAK